MGVGRKKQRRLAPKLLRIREALGLSQSGLRKELGLKGLYNSSISRYEAADLEPPLWVLLKYARAARVCLEVLVDDQLELPLNIPATQFYCPHCEKNE